MELNYLEKEMCLKELLTAVACNSVTADLSPTCGRPQALGRQPARGLLRVRGAFGQKLPCAGGSCP